MIEELQKIKRTAIAMKETSSVNDIHYDQLQDIVDIVDDLLVHYINDGR